MTRTEMENRMKEIERKRFFLAMKDFWSRDDFKEDDKMKAEWKELKKTLDN